MKNINSIIKNKQLLTLTGVLVFIGVLCIGLLVATSSKKPGAALSEREEAKPNLTGVVTSSFTDQVQTASLQQQQASTNELQTKLDRALTMLEQQASQQEAQSRSIEELKSRNRELAGELESYKKSGAGLLPQSLGAGDPIPNALKGGVAAPTSFYSVTNTPGGAATANGALGGAGGHVSYGLEPQAIERISFSRNKTKKKSSLPYIPSGSFSESIMIEGADANASVTGQQNTSPVEFRLRGKLQMPNDKEYDLSGCFVTGEIWGDISSERGEVRTRKLSCHLPQGTIDMKLPGHVAYQGKQGIRGVPVMRNGPILAYAGAAGFLSGVGSGMKTASTPVVGIGATTSMGTEDIVKGGFGEGAEKAASTLSDYWVKRAEQYHPVIDIGAGNLVTVVFQDGFQLATIEELAEKDEGNSATDKTQGSAMNAVMEGVQAIKENSLPVNPESTNTAIPSPDEIIRQAKQLQLGQVIQ